MRSVKRRISTSEFPNGVSGADLRDPIFNGLIFYELTSSSLYFCFWHETADVGRAEHVRSARV